jgi:hypothetical protein
VGRSLSAISGVSGVDRSTVWRFEEKGTWPRKPDEMVAAYAKAIGLDDARELWDVALKMWYRHGKAPALPEDGARAITKDLERELDAFLTKREEASPEVSEEHREARS